MFFFIFYFFLTLNVEGRQAGSTGPLGTINPKKAAGGDRRAGPRKSCSQREEGAPGGAGTPGSYLPVIRGSDKAGSPTPAVPKSG